MTQAEKRLWFLFLRKLSVTVLRQKPLDGFIVDFYCASAKLVIEVDGGGHFTEEGREYDKQRTKVLEGYGLKVIRFTNTEIMNNFREVCSEIAKHLYPPTPFSKGGNLVR